MADLTEAGYVEDAGAAPPEELTERERERYGRSTTLPRRMDLRPGKSAWEPRLRLRRPRVLLVGVGGTGGAAARDLVASGVGRLHCVDPDVVELPNLNRRTFRREQDFGTPKTDAAPAALRALNSDTTVTGERREVRGPGDLLDLLTGSGTVGNGATGTERPAREHPVAAPPTSYCCSPPIGPARSAAGPTRSVSSSAPRGPGGQRRLCRRSGRTGRDQRAVAGHLAAQPPLTAVREVRRRAGTRGPGAAAGAGRDGPGRRPVTPPSPPPPSSPPSGPRAARRRSPGRGLRS
ncbi:ThiF family adenylyltransferase [Streptomyces sp. NPDC000983]|uniref:ThiF family adenylyltransferase n=1 Tax=Streptomyces sp. NPDC000983 TaxID=3154373 RepID=UPI00332C65A4